MDYKRSDRVGDLLLELISELLAREVSDPRIGSVTLTGAEVSKDLRHARIYFRLLGAAEKKAEAPSAALEDPAIARDAEELHRRQEKLEEARAKVNALFKRWEELDARSRG